MSAAIQLEFAVEDAVFQAALERYARESGKEWGEVIVQQARLLAVNLAFQTQPFGDAGKLTGEKAVSRDLALVYAFANDVYAALNRTDEAAAKGFWKAAQRKDWREAQRILSASASQWRNVEIGPFKAEHHRQSRGRRGRVNRHVPAQIVTDPKTAAKYVKTKLRMVGFSKAGWASAAASLTGNTRGIPQWVTRHKGKAPGSAENRSKAPIDAHVVLHNDVSYIRETCPPAQRAKALQYQRGKMLASMKKSSAAVARKTLGPIAAVTA